MKSSLAVLLLCLSSAWAYKILFVFPAMSKSNDLLGKGVVRALLKAGHEVTWAATYKQKNVHTNLTIIDLPETRKIVETFDLITMVENKNLSFFSFMRDHTRRVATVTSQNTELRKVLVEKQFDAVMTTYYLNDFEAGFDEPSKAALYESIFTPLAAARGVPLLPYYDAQHNVSILLVNSHESLAPGFNAPANVINIAGYYIDEDPAPLPKDLQDLLDGSPQGVIYFSLGSVVRASGMDPKKRDALVRMFGKLPYTVLWKFEEPLSDLPPNVHVRPWLPQPSILAHKNTIVFITHGGQSSTVEAIYAGMPVVAVPVAGDQPANAERAVREGYAVQVDFYKDELADDLEAALKELLSNEKYRERVKFLSMLFRARPVPPAKLIPFYVELAIETKGAHHLRSLSLKYKWYERWMLDFVLALLGELAALAWLVRLAVRACVRRFRGDKKQTADKKRN